jgi:hypothetical protein
LNNVAFCDKGVAILDFVGHGSGDSSNVNIFKGLRLVNKLNRVTFSAKLKDWEKTPEVPIMCWDETGENYKKPRRTLSESCIQFPFLPNIYN